MHDYNRVVRIALCVDEVCKVVRDARRSGTADFRKTITYDEYRICGGVTADATKEFSFYRQLVLAKRDAKTILSSKQHPFQRTAFTKALELYEFYPSDEDTSVPTNNQQGNNNRRVAKVLANARTALRTNTPSAMTRDDAYKEIVLAKRYLAQIMEGRHTPDVKACESSDCVSDDEDVENLDKEEEEENDEGSSSAGELVD